MAMNLINLEMVRELMLKEVDADISNENIYLSLFMPLSAKKDYAKILKEEITGGNETTLSERASSLMTVPSRKTNTNKKSNSHITFAEGEFNRYYMRGVCIKAVALGKNVIVYRARESSVHRIESDAKIDFQLDPNKLLEDLRAHQGLNTVLGLPPGPNSGLSVKVVD